MAGDIRIRLVSELYPKGFNDAVAGMKKVEDAYTASTGKILSNAKGSIPKLTANIKKLLSSSVEDAPKQAVSYFESWSQALIRNFTGGDSAKLKAQVERAIREIVNAGVDENQLDTVIPKLNKSLEEYASLYDSTATEVESSSRRKQAMYEKEVAVLQRLGLRSEEYNLTMQNAKAQMMALTPSMKNYESEMERLSAEYTNAKTKLAELNAEQSKASKGGMGQYVGTVVKSYLAHQAVASAIQTVKQGLKEASQASAEAEQKMNKLNTVFEGFNETAKATAKELASSIGVAVSTASSSLTTVGDLLQAQGMGVAESLTMASDWVKNFQDIINFKDINESLDEFSKNMMAGFLGNTRNLRTVGVVVKDSAVQAELASRNMDKLTGSELELAKMNIRAEMTFKQLSNAMGATEREWDTNLAVNRRLNEAWLTYKENLGDTVNSILKPMKSAWTDVLTQINKANQAQKEFNAGAKEINVYDIRNNDKDARAFSNTISSIGQSYSTGMRYAGQNVRGFVMDSEETVTKRILDQLNREMIIFNASVEDVRKELGDRLTPAMYEWLEATEAERRAEIQREKDIQSRIGTLTTASEKFDTFQEKLLGITGVSFASSDFSGAIQRASGSDSGMNYILGQMADFTAQNIDSAIKSIAEADLSAWGDVINGELEGLDIPDLFEKKMESVAELFSATWNEYLKDGVITDEEKAKLEEIKKLYADLGVQLDEHNAKLEKEKNLQSAINSAQKSTTDYQRQLLQIEMSDEEKYVSDLTYEYLDQVEALKLTKDEADELWEQYDAQAKAYIALQKASKEYNDQLDAEQKRKDMLSDYSTQSDDYRTQLANLGKRDRQIQMDAFGLALSDAEKKGDTDLASEIRDAMQSFEELQDALERIELEDKVKEITGRFSGLAYETEIATLRMDDNEKALYELDHSYAQALKEMDELGEDTTELTDNYEAQRSSLVQLQKLTKDYNDELEARAEWERRLAERNSQLQSYQTGGSNDYITQLANLGKTSAEITRAGMVSARDVAGAKGDAELWTAIQAQIVAFDELQKKTEELAHAQEVATAQASIASKVNPFSSTINAYETGSTAFGDTLGGAIGGIIGILAEILSQTEAFKTVQNIISNYIVPVFDRILAPMLPMIEMMAETLAGLIDALFVPVIVPALESAIIALDIISRVIMTISAIVKTIYYAITLQWGKIDETWSAYGEDQRKQSETTGKALEALLGVAQGIETNTSNKEDNSALLKAYGDMFANQMITASEYDALVAGLNGIHYDRVKSYNGTSWNNGSGGTTVVYSGDMKFTIEGTNLSADEIAEAVLRKQQQWASTAQYH